MRGREAKGVETFLRVVYALVALAMLTGTPARAMGKDVVILGTATPGGGFPVYGAAFAEAVNEADPSLEVRPRTTKGSTENIPLLEAGKLDIALVQGEVAHEVLSSDSGLKIIAAMYSSAGMFAVRADSSARSIRDLVGKPVIFGARGSGLVVLARHVLDGMGLDPDSDFKAIDLDRVHDAPQMILDRHAAALWGGGVGWPAFEAVAKDPVGARFIVPSAEEISRIIAKRPFLRRLTVPARSYPGQESPITSVGSWSFVLARPSFPDDIAYRLARALHRSEAALGARLPQARETTLANTRAAAPRQDLIHPGVVKYMREAGIIP